MDPATHDVQLRKAAFDHVNRIASLKGGVLDSADLLDGFDFGGEHIRLINPQRGIFKPRKMAGLLSIRTVFPRQGGRVWYEDQREAHSQIYAGDDVVEYAFMGTDPNSPDNRWVWDARQRQIRVPASNRVVPLSNLGVALTRQARNTQPNPVKCKWIAQRG